MARTRTLHARVESDGITIGIEALKGLLQLGLSVRPSFALLASHLDPAVGTHYCTNPVIHENSTPEDLEPDPAGAALC